MGDLPPEVLVGEAVDSLKRLIEEVDFKSEGDRSRALAISSDAPQGILSPVSHLRNVSRDTPRTAASVERGHRNSDRK